MPSLRLVAALCAALLAVPCLAAPDPEAPKIQLAILLDTSSSMDGLINQTREQLWRIVNTFATAKRDGKQATLELALYEYGNDGIPAGELHVRQVVPLTTDLDRVSDALFKLRTNGGSEYCGAVIQKALGGLEWSSRPKDLKLLYVAGNEPFTQGPVNFRDAVKAAIARGVVVNTIHAGGAQEGVNGGWAEAAKLADGQYTFIDQNRAVAQIAAPQDSELVRLSGELNKTYVGYGRAAPAAAVRQAEQDKNAAGLGAGSAATRAASKASVHYDNSGWDLVDAKKKGVKVEALGEAELPAELKALKPEERKAFVEKKEQERADLQAQIAKLSKERETFIAKETAKRAKDGAKSLDDAVVETAKTKAVANGYAF